MSVLTDRLMRRRMLDDLERSTARAIGEGTGDERHHVAGTGADHARLRGIPAIGRGVSGAIRGTDPERHVLESDRRASLHTER